MANINKSITTPIAQNHTSSAMACLPWFVCNSEYSPSAAGFRPLVNGRDAFAAVYKAIADAKHSIDIICWGFQPSMYFLRDGTGKRIGELLEQKGKEGVKVRLLCWRDPFYMAELSENNMPGNDFITPLKRALPKWVYDHVSMLGRDYQTDEERVFDINWYQRANLNNVTNPVSHSVTDRIIEDTVNLPLNVVAALSKPFTSGSNPVLHKIAGFPNIELATRGFDLSVRSEIVGRISGYGTMDGWSGGTKATTSAAMGGEPSHHQKMVLVDYDDSDLATGFVMGHNMLDQYWDTDKHSYQAMAPSKGRNGPYPWQDISSRVTGPILQYLNKNFCEAWDDATGQKLAKSREHLAGIHKIRNDAPDDVSVMAQIVRTQSEKNKREIQVMYLNAVNNATQCIFIQNQYFRWNDLALKIKDVAKAHAKAGRDFGRDGSIYLFVITNSSDDAVGNGTVRTYQMLESLGCGNSMPGVAQLQRSDDYAAQQKDLEAQLAAQQSIQHKFAAQGVDINAASLQGAMNFYQDNMAKQQELQQALNELKRKKQLNAHIDPDAPPLDIEGLKVQVCTLVAPDSPGGNWLPVYVHAKLMTIDDAFMTIGSANVNLRSMNVDSELNICHENSVVTKSLRQRLWSMHAGDKGAQEDFFKSFMAWHDIVEQNKVNKTKNLPPEKSLVKFVRTSAKRTYAD
ncbi:MULTISPECIES: phospholipase D-like domain-containing protein [Burkholderia]|jgi:phosphatidylserine/phosphatidylglycerophosphate/cardiolipin synthase-like enzyme|uniref:Phospholipase D protein n=1 Tax=Burkholderia cenocepacia (strain ATCC BAA-245 / DSM 16553 / LMG 16656 / NCTC 13227 / J2315 / CF5610) TaxID=216591 RepID=B4EH49_BURCJ|nr:MULTISPECIES: phosphatidylserine/phosphatidylglycerophosphate/cardiolipin synthase family protein [Burkholderia]EPZ90222.1 phospholipase D family protein [Burkholderia cenocepacia K56-2Valvano]ERI24749.1 phospholipase D family protein [Burkholderia cenocepacia BC7]KKI80750.1 phospholipase [Burkholderia cenocepacia]MCL4631220.1 phosphatidylserine/phosphatidylglycerophosphate/cardiolipin synthase family protein [Burkholderia sp.]MEB2501268.1 phosphatidylserine/phosphatidylglycerophosphate/car